MFSNTAFEAMYQYLGLELHAKSIDIITSHKVFGAVILFIFGVMFFVTATQFFSRYIPGPTVHRKPVPLSKFIKVIGCLFLGIALLEARFSTSVKRFNGESWHQNSYIHGQLRQVEPEYKVSLIFDLMSRTAEEFAALLARTIDQLVGSTHSQLDAPNFFFKAIMYGAAATIEDVDLKRSIHFYTEECFNRVLPLVKEVKNQNKLDGFFADSSVIDQKLSEMPIQLPDRVNYTCLDVKKDVTESLRAYAMSRQKDFGTTINTTMGDRGSLRSENFLNLQVSSMLVDHYLTEHEGWMGVQKGSLIPTTGGRIAQYLNRIISVDGILSIFGMKEAQGVWVSAARAKEFSENLARAPHVAGFIKMFCIFLFPWLIFFVVAGHYQVLYVWFVIYFSVLLWAPIWTLMYHIMVGIALSAETMDALGRLSDGVSLYGAELVNARIYHLFEVYSWLQLVVGTLFTGGVLWWIVPLLRDGRGDSTPEFIENSANAVTTGAQVAGAVL
ncbi:hypothetical protein WDW37_07365 [Bdellovibrionota bacterium FG-1]